MNNFISNYNKISDILKDFGIPESNKTQIRKPKLCDRDLVALNLTAEYQGVDSEHQLFRVIVQTPLDGLISRTVYNRRKKGLFSFIENIRCKMSQYLNCFEDYFIVDSMPLEVCKLSRSSRSKICKESFYSAPDKGFCASQQLHFYGYKIHATCSVKGVFNSLDISKASVHDIYYLSDIQYKMKDCVLLGDKGYLSYSQQINLFESANIKLT